MSGGAKTPVAWLQLSRELPRMIVAVLGIAFAAILIFMQLGILESLFDSCITPHRMLDADLIMINPRQQILLTSRSFSRHHLYRALGYPGVKSITSLLVATLPWRNPIDRTFRSILVFGINPEASTFTLPEVRQNLDRLKQLKSVLFDNASRPEFGPVATLFRKRGTVISELNNRCVSVAGIYPIGASFAADGTVITSDTTFSVLYPDHRPGQIEVGLIKTIPGVDLEALRNTLQTNLGPAVRICTLSEFCQLEKNYWGNSTGIGFIFGLGVVVGWVVGVVVVYQILHADVSDHLPEYATLKAMGYSDRFLLKVLLSESAILAVCAYVPAFMVATLLYSITRASTFMPITMTWERAVFVFAMTLVMCAVSAVLAGRKLRRADPAEIFA
jgi:putative ABC transport system permease protein